MALTGAIVGGRCYGSYTEAVDAFYSTFAPVQTAGATGYVQQAEKVADSWLFRSYEIGPGGQLLRFEIPAQIPSFAACDPTAAFFDGIALGWGIAIPMILVSAVMLTRRGARA
jgi:hypothetical protein